ncbi:aminodeoxychorismate synthase component I [Azovibrio restrictus]|uniref:aminodeoxychorismate synthase component I n=1 Tax=Azovibrio restrictus TaxID=146938 RepID=UPI0026EFF075|nr:aminodeoxychorismate synthase component I [Azovibrio restrictus]
MLEFALFEDRLAAPGQPAAWLFEAPAACREIHDCAQLQAALQEIAAQGLWSVWVLDYELGYLLEPKAQGAGQIDVAPARPFARLIAYARARSLDQSELDAWWAAQPPFEAAGVGGLKAGLDEAAYQAAVARIQAYIRAGDCYQVNFTFPLHFQAYGRPLDLYRRLRQSQPVRYGGFVQSASGTLISLSPELFLTRQGQRLLTRPMKGTAARAEAAAADAQAAADLANSAKNRAENLMIVDLLRNDLGRLALPGSVQVSQLFQVESYPTVHQMVSQVEARVADPDDFRLLEALFPCGSITGAPKVRAMQIIHELEAGPRGLYTGALGWRSPEGELRLNVAIRTLELDAAGRGRMGLGSGIVADSVAADEWRECLLKGRFLTALDPGLELIETLRLEVAAGRPCFPRLEGHCRRMAESATWLGFPWSRETTLATLEAQAEGLGDGVYRLRLTLNKAGVLDVRCVPLTPEPEGERLLLLADAVIQSRDPLRRHKTTSRSLYDQALARVAERPEVFDVLFLNEQGRVAEGARSNVFARIDGEWLTPPLASGALPGVFRAEMLAAGLAREADLNLADLRRAEEIRCGNALRGWVPVTLVEAAP